VCGRGDYSSVQHRFRFKIEEYSGNRDFSCGIISKPTLIESLLYTSNNYNTFGAYSAHNNNGLLYFTNYDSDAQTDDIVELFIDCDKQTIRLTNR